MGIKFYCPTCDKRLNVKSFLAGKSGFCPHCQAKVQIPAESEPKRTATAEAGASTLIRQESRLPEAHEEAATPSGHASGNGRTIGHASTPAPTSNGGSTPAAPGVVAPPGNAPQTVQAAPAPHANPQPAHTAAPVRPAMAATTAPAVPATPAAPVAPAAPAVGDAIAEAPHAVWYVRPPAGGQYGPAAGDVMRKWLGEGRVSADSLVWREGWPDWRKAAKVFPSLMPAPAPAAPATAASAAAPLPGPAASSSRRAIRTPRRRDSSTFAVTAIIVLVLASLALLGGLLWVLGVIG